MIPPALMGDIRDLIRRAHKPWLHAVCLTLEAAPDFMDAKSLTGTMPATNNNNAAHCLADIIRRAEGLLSWKSLGTSLDLCTSMLSQWPQEERIELLWAGPSPPAHITARRIDQVFYDLIDSAKKEILLVTFAAHKIPRLVEGLIRAINRGVRVRLILEFEGTSQGQLSMDAMNAFPTIICQRSAIYYWPLEMRERNGQGRPGKLHAKAAIVDDQAILSSANLTDDAFTRNLELGALVSNEEFVQRIRSHFDGLSSDGTLKRWAPGSGIYQHI
jgi:cardiolipin synthase